MRVRWMTILLLAALGGCAWFSGSRKVSVYFEPYSATLSQQSRDTIGGMAKFAQAHPLQPIAIDGYSAPPDPNRDVDGLSAKRADVVKQALVADGVDPHRITAAANGIVDPQARGLPNVAMRRVDIDIGR